MAEKETPQEEISKRYQTLPVSKLDAGLGERISNEWRTENDARGDKLRRREEYTANWRDLNGPRTQGPWENASDFHVPLTLIDGKAIHARLWQLFSDFGSLVGVKARKATFEGREEAVKSFMTFLLSDHCNSRMGVRDTFDEWLWNVVFDGEEYLKLYSVREVHEYLEVVPKTTVKQETAFDPQNTTGKTTTEVKMEEAEEIRTEVLETPHIKRVLNEDVLLPKGECDPQTASWVKHRVAMSAADLKARARDKKFDPKVVEEILKLKMSAPSSANQEDQIKTQRAEMDGFSDSTGYAGDLHYVIEHYGREYIGKNADGEASADMSRFPQEVVVWVHQGTGKTLGWTYLYRISPSGIRPLFKADFIRFPDRGGVGAAEVLAPINDAIDATYNLRYDNGVMASMQFGAYRASSGLKPDKIQIEPGMMIPVDDPQSDIRMMQFPFLNGFGYQEEDRLTGYAERVLTISDINLGRTPNKVGGFRTASGANALQSESGIQLEIHFDRLARTLSRLFQALFRLARERMTGELFYRVTGERGEPVFGKVNRADLRGEYDFEINVDVLGESRQEAQQKATLLMQTLINPAFMQSGVVSPSNLYHLAKNFLQKNRFRRVDNYITPPQQYTGEVVTPSERIHSIVVGMLEPDPAESVRLNENHEEALKTYDGFEQSDYFGLMTQPEQLAAFDRLKKKHVEMMTAQQAGGNPNMSGMQIPRDGMSPLEAGGMDQGTLGAPMGEVNGPVV